MSGLLPDGSTFLEESAAGMSRCAVAVCFSLGASDCGRALQRPESPLMCTCGCAQLLGECNHVGCPDSGRERNELSAAIASGHQRRAEF